MQTDLLPTSVRALSLSQHTQTDHPPQSFACALTHMNAVLSPPMPFTYASLSLVVCVSLLSVSLSLAPAVQEVFQVRLYIWGYDRESSVCVCASVYVYLTVCLRSREGAKREKARGTCILLLCHMRRRIHVSYEEEDTRERKRAGPIHVSYEEEDTCAI